MSKYVPEPTIDPELQHYDSKPTLRTFEGVIAYCAEQGIAVSANLVRADAASGALRKFRIGHANHYSPRDVQAWLKSKRMVEVSA